MPRGRDYADTQLELSVVRDCGPGGLIQEVRELPRDVIEMTMRELLTAALGSSQAEACGRLVDLCADFRELGLRLALVSREAGLSRSVANRLAAIFEIARRYGQTEWRPGAAFRGASDVYAHFREHMSAECSELFYAVLLDNKHRKIRDVLVSKGSLTASIVHPRDLFLQVIRFAAASVILVHNHPSGDPTPSKEDLEVTRRLREVGDIIGVRVLDHVVIGKGKYVSFVDDGYW